MGKKYHAIKVDYKEDPKKNKIVPLTLDFFHTVLSTIDSVITYSQREKDNSVLKYRKQNGNDFCATEKEGTIEITGKITQSLANRLEDYRIYIPEKIA